MAETPVRSRRRLRGAMVAARILPASAPAEPVLLRLAASCPRCGARPAMRITDALVGALRWPAVASAERIGTYQCQRRGCGAVYDITAAAVLGAS